jgi:hypothetical protein
MGVLLEPASNCGDLDRLRAVHVKAVNIIVNRKTSYADHWEKEDIKSLWQNIFRKSEGLKNMVQIGATDLEKEKEDLLDLINAASMVYARIDK